MAFSFPVDDVTPAGQRLPEGSATLAQRFGGEPIAVGDGVFPLVEAGNDHPLLAAVALAYNTHRPLLLSPDVVWITLAQGFAMHVRHNSEALRHRFVRHLGKKAIQLEVDRWDAIAWPDIVGRFVRALGQELGDEMTRLIECDFSTTGPTERMASHVVMLDVFQPYFDYELAFICGIPQVTLLGEVADWEQIRRRLDVLAAYDLDWWVQPLRPVADAWLETARGRPDRDFWQCIYTPKEVYGGELVCGWIGRLFPYTATGERIPFVSWSPEDMPPRRRRRAGPSGGHAIKDEKVLAVTPRRAAWLRAPLDMAVHPGLSQVPVYADGVGGKRRYTVIGGFVGVAQEPGGLGLFPRVGWALREDPMLTVLDRLRPKIQAVASPVPPPVDAEDRGPNWAIPGALRALYDEHGDAGARVGQLVVRPRWVVARQGWYRTLLRFADLPDGAGLGYPAHGRGGPVVEIPAARWWRFWRPTDSGKLPVIAKSILELLERLANEDGLYFRKSGFQPLKMLNIEF